MRSGWSDDFCFSFVSTGVHQMERRHMLKRKDMCRDRWEGRGTLVVFIYSCQYR